MSTVTPEQNLDFNLYLVERFGLESTANVARNYATERNWLALYDMVDDLEKAELPKDITKNIRVALSALVMEKIETDVNSTGGLNNPDPKPSPDTPKKDKDDDDLVAA